MGNKDFKSCVAMTLIFCTNQFLVFFIKHFCTNLCTTFGYCKARLSVAKTQKSITIFQKLPLVLIHGWGCGAGYFKNMNPLLARDRGTLIFGDSFSVLFQPSFLSIYRDSGSLKELKSVSTPKRRGQIVCRRLLQPWFQANVLSVHTRSVGGCLR